jgi:hypothetical protein
MLERSDPLSCQSTSIFVYSEVELPRSSQGTRGDVCVPKVRNNDDQHAHSSSHSHLLTS